MKRGKRGKTLIPGRYYDNASNEVPPVAPSEVDVRVCRRVADFPRGEAPARAATGRCEFCGEGIAYNAATAIPAPKVCMQCMGIEPLPMEDEDGTS